VTTDPRPPGRDETPEEHADRNFSELVQELRVAQNGVQILFAFLLPLPFLADFPDAPQYTRVYTGALMSSACATIAFIAPVAFHRTLFRKGRKEDIVRLAHRMSVVGLVLLAVAMGLASWLALAILWSDASAWVTVAALLTGVALAWIALPRWVTRGRPPVGSAEHPHRAAHRGS
jgi:O-antigen/teichoic acid export membrane protein